MKSTIIKKAGKVIGVVVPNPDLALSCTVVPRKGTKVQEVELSRGEGDTREQFLEHLQKLGVKLVAKERARPKKSPKRR